MRSKRWTVASALAALLSLAVTASASAALPEFVNREGTSVVKKGFTITSRNFLIGESGGIAWRCFSGGSGKGEIKAASEVTKVLIEPFKECGTQPQLKLKELQGRIGYYEHGTTHKLTGLLLTPVTPPIVGETGEIKLDGSVIGAITPKNVYTKEFTVEFLPTTGLTKHQEIKHFEGEEVMHQLELIRVHGTEAYIEVKMTLKTEEEVEIKA